MAKTIIGLFESKSEANSVLQDLLDNDFTRNEVVVTDKDDLSSISTLMSRAGVPAQDARFYEQGVSGGDALVVVQTEDSKASKAAQILSKYNMIDVDSRHESYKASGTTDVGLTDFDEDGTVIPIVEEELQVGKRQVQRGGVRVISRVVETPVEQDVTLREERVHVERRPVDRPVTDADAAAFKEGTFELTETAEEAVVAKQARVVEEVVVGKTAEERTQHISDTVRRTDVDVEQIDAATTGTVTTGATTTTSTTTASGASTLGATTDDSDTYFRSYYDTNLTNSGYTYDEYSPVFDYGTSLRNDTRYAGKDWDAIEGDARTQWEAQNPGTWDKFKASVRHAWDRATK